MTDAAASELAKKRWRKTSPDQRSEIARKLNEAKYANMSDEDRAANRHTSGQGQAQSSKKEAIPMKSRLLLMLAALLLIAMPIGVANGQGCGAPPPPPPPPPGCSKLVPVCTCDQNGRNCKYTWQCVPN